MNAKFTSDVIVCAESRPRLTETHACLQNDDSFFGDFAISETEMEETYIESRPKCQESVTDNFFDDFMAMEFDGIERVSDDCVTTTTSTTTTSTTSTLTTTASTTTR